MFVASRKSRAKPRWVRDLAAKRVKTLFALAEKEHKEHPERSKRYAQLALKEASKYNIRIPEAYRARICKNCGAFLVPGENLKVRVQSKDRVVTYTCLECGKPRKTGYSREKKKKA